MPAIKHVLHHATQNLQAAGIDTARLDARVLLKHVTGRDDTWLLAHGDEALPEAEAAAYEKAIQRRLRYEPVAHITGKKEFWGLDFTVNTATLVPRPDSEILVEAVLRRYAEQPQDICLLDLGTGSGCLLIALLHAMPMASGVGIDISLQALATAGRNATQLGVAPRARWLASDWLAAVDGRFACVLANPPYIPLEDKAALAPDVRNWEPEQALFAGKDGLEAYKRLARETGDVITGNGRLFMEIGQGQAAAVTDIMQEHGWRLVKTYPDLAGIPRCQEYARAHNS